MLRAPITMLTPQSVRIKTDMRDAYMITQCLSYGGYHAVYIPTGERKGERMEGSHELVLPNGDLSFRMFLKLCQGKALAPVNRDVCCAGRQTGFLYQ